MAHYDVTRNRFNPENRFIGDIEDGKRYPFGCYTKEEADERFAVKSTESDLTALSEVVDTKADQSALSALSDTVDTKASTSDLTAYETSNDAQIADIIARLEVLEYAPIEIVSYNIDKTLAEKGSSQTVSLSWVLSKTAQWEEINGSEVTGSAKTFADVNANTIYTLQVSDGKKVVSKAVSIEFANHIFYGATGNISDLSGLTSILSEKIERSFTTTAGAGQYIVYAYPKRLGIVQFFVEGWEGGFDGPAEVTFTNQSGYEEVYYIYKSTNANLGKTTVEVKEES